MVKYSAQTETVIRNTNVKMTDVQDVQDGMKRIFDGYDIPGRVFGKTFHVLALRDNSEKESFKHFFNANCRNIYIFG